MIKKAGVVGYPVKHSLSPKLHRYWLKQCAIEGADYVHLEIEPNRFEEEIRALSSKGFVGFNVTVPYKEKIIPLVDEIKPVAKIMGAVNTVFIEKERLVGTNTDAFGFIENIRQTEPDFDFTAGPAVVLGAGGAAKAVVFGLLEAGVPKVIITNRTAHKSEAIKERFNSMGTIDICDWDKKEEVLQEAHLLVNSTSLGMEGMAPLELRVDGLPKTALVTDIVYKPLKTPLLCDAESQGNRIVDGLGMLCYQAMAGFRGWFGGEPTVTPDLREMMLGG